MAEQHKYYPPDFDVRVTYKRYTAGDMRVNDEKNLDLRGEVAKIWLDIRSLNLAPLQRERFIFLLGRRYNPKKLHDCKIVVKQYATYSENYIRAFEILKQIYWEALRAPGTDVTSQRNPYRREYLLKKKFGKTKEQRDKFLKVNSNERNKDRLEGEPKLNMIDHLTNEHMKKRDQELQELAQKGEADGRSLRAKRREQAALRAKLGFREPEAEHEFIEDAVADKLDQDKRRYETKIAEAQTRKSIKVVTEIVGLSKEE